MIQAAGSGCGAAGVDLLPHLQGDGDHGVSVERGDARARTADRRARVAEDDEALRPDGGHDHRRRDRAHRDLGVCPPPPTEPQSWPRGWACQPRRLAQEGEPADLDAALTDRLDLPFQGSRARFFRSGCSVSVSWSSGRVEMGGCPSGRLARADSTPQARAVRYCCNRRLCLRREVDFNAESWRAAARAGFAAGDETDAT